MYTVHCFVNWYLPVLFYMSDRKKHNFQRNKMCISLKSKSIIELMEKSSKVADKCRFKLVAVFLFKLIK